MYNLQCHSSDNYQDTKKQENAAQNKEKNQSIETSPELIFIIISKVLGIIQIKINCISQYNKRKSENKI